MGYEVWIYTNEKRPKYIYGSTSLDINVESKPYDGLSKRFKKVTHTIQYKGHYIISDYYFQIYNPNGGYYSKYIFKYKQPIIKLNAVDIFFKNDDSNNNVPLILGFKQHSNETEYFTYKFLCNYTNGWIGYYEKPGSLPTGSFKESDLLTRLLEETGPRVGKENTIVINLNQKPRRQDNYPVSGPNSKKITVKKEDSSVSGYEKYVHTISNARVEQFYFSYNSNSMYFQTDDRSGQFVLNKVTVYFEESDPKNPVLFLLSFGGKLDIYEYKYYDFVTELKTLTSTSASKKINKLKVTESSNLQSTLKEETERLRQLIAFQTGGTGSSSSNVNVTTKGPEPFKGDQGVGGITFKKVTMNVNSDDAKGGSSVGPWTVFSTKLFTDNNGRTIGANPTIPKDVLTGITTGDVSTSGSSKKYSSITVYYATKTGSTDNYSDYKALLLEFVNGSGDKKYIKRVKGGTEWADAKSEINNGGTGVTADELTKIREAAFGGGGEAAGSSSGSNGGGSSAGPEPAGHSSVEDGGDSSSSSTAARDAGIGCGVVGVCGLGAGVGYAIYKYPQVFLSLIGR